MAKILHKVSEKHGFATNSSSYHSIIIKPEDTENKIAKGTYIIEPGEFGWGSYGESYTDWQTKASYFLTYFLNKNDIDKEGESLEIPLENEELKQYKEMLDDHIGNAVFQFLEDTWYPNGDIDHNSWDMFEDLGDYPMETIEKIIFSDSILFIENDNDDMMGPRGIKKIEDLKFVEDEKNYYGDVAPYWKDKNDSEER